MTVCPFEKEIIPTYKQTEGRITSNLILCTKNITQRLCNCVHLTSNLDYSQLASQTYLLTRVSLKRFAPRPAAHVLNKYDFDSKDAADHNRLETAHTRRFQSTISSRVSKVCFIDTNTGYYVQIWSDNTQCYRLV